MKITKMLLRFFKKERKKKKTNGSSLNFIKFEGHFTLFPSDLTTNLNKKGGVTKNSKFNILNK
jgi:hypothetical protein